MLSRGASLVVLVGTALSFLSKWIIVWLIARYSGGPEMVGAYSSLLSIATPVFVVAQLGLRTILLSSNEPWPWASYVTLRCIGTIVGGGALALAWTQLSTGAPYSLMIVVIVMKLVDSGFDLIMGRIQYGNQMGALGALLSLTSVLAIVAAVLAAIVMGSATWVVLSGAVVTVSMAPWAIQRARRVSVPGGQLTIRSVSGILKSSFPVTLSQLLASLLFQLPIVFLAWTAPLQVTGVYSASAYILTVASLVGTTLQTLLITPFRRARENEGARALLLNSQRVVRETLLLSCIAGIVICFVGGPAIRLVYGPDFEIGLVPLCLLAVASVATVVAYVESVTLTVLNRYSDVSWAMGLSCVMSVAVGAFTMQTSLGQLVGAAGMAAAGACSRGLLMAVLVRRQRRVVP